MTLEKAWQQRCQDGLVNMACYYGVYSTCDVENLCCEDALRETDMWRVYTGN